jgi:transposase
MVKVGIDIAAKKFDAAIRTKERVISSQCFSNDETGFKDLVVWLKSHLKTDLLQTSVIMEATGVYHENLAYFLHKLGFPVCIVLANVATAFAKSHNIKSKNDKIDARTLAKLGLERELRVWVPCSESARDIKQVTREQEDLAKARTVVLNQLHALKSGHYVNEILLSRLEAHLSFLEEQQSSVEKHLKTLINADPRLKADFDHMVSIIGIGLLSAATILGETDGFALFTNRNQLVSFAGYDVVTHQSGKSVNKPPHISKKGNSHIRRVLYMAAMSAIQHNSECAALYERVFKKTGIKMKGVVAVQRKLLVLTYAVVKNKCDYDIEKHRKDAVPKVKGKPSDGVCVEEEAA